MININIAERIYLLEVVVSGDKLLVVEVLLVVVKVVLDEVVEVVVGTFFYLFNKHLFLNIFI